MLTRPAERLKIAATYRVGQPIENFVLRLKIVQKKWQLGELFATEGETRDTNYPIAEEREIRWQEKIFSPREVAFYGDEKNCATDLHNEYRARIVEMENNATETSRLYTEIHEDGEIMEKSYLTGVGDGEMKKISKLAMMNDRALPTMKNRKPFGERYNKRVVDDVPRDNRSRENHFLYRDRKRMRIMVDLSAREVRDGVQEENFVSPDSKILLCTIVHDSAGKTLSIEPDFSCQTPYSLETSSGLFYDYFIEDASLTGPIEDRSTSCAPGSEKKKISKEEKLREMTMPPSNVFRLVVNLEIVSAEKFQYDPLFVAYEIELPKDWRTTENDRLSGRTQRACAVNGSANFAYMNEIELDFDLNSLDAIRVQPNWPRIILIVGSYDRWTRYRVEGYATMSLPATPGLHIRSLSAWRPISGFVDRLRRFFTGGAAQLEDPAYSGVPERRDSSRLEKTRLRVAPAGAINLRLNCAHQSKLFARRGGLVDETPPSPGTLVNTLDDVLERFKAARDRMIRARAIDLS